MATNEAGWMWLIYDRLDQWTEQWWGTQQMSSHHVLSLQSFDAVSRHNSLCVALEWNVVDLATRRCCCCCCGRRLFIRSSVRLVLPVYVCVRRRRYNITAHLSCPIRHFVERASCSTERDSVVVASAAIIAAATRISVSSRLSSFRVSGAATRPLPVMLCRYRPSSDQMFCHKRPSTVDRRRLLLVWTALIDFQCNK